MATVESYGPHTQEVPKAYQKVLSQVQVSKRIQGIRRFNEFSELDETKAILVSGVFDLFHPGHLILFETVMKWADANVGRGKYVILIRVASDEYVRKFKSPNRPILNQDERVLIVAAQASVHAAFIDPGSVGPTDIEGNANSLREINPHIVAIERSDEHFANKEAAVVKAGLEILVVDVPYITSTTQIVNRISKQNG